MKRLKDYPLEEWMEAADGCEYCGANDKVMVTWVDETGARAFEKLETIFSRGKPTEKDQAMAQVCKGMAEVCIILADLRSREDEKKGILRWEKNRDE